MNDMYVWKGPVIWRQEAAYFLNQELLRNASRISFRCPAKLNASQNHPIDELAGAAGLSAHITWLRMFGGRHVLPAAEQMFLPQLYMSGKLW